jgi:hypothetical protein
MLVKLALSIDANPTVFKIVWRCVVHPQRHQHQPSRIALRWYVPRVLPHPRNEPEHEKSHQDQRDPDEDRHVPVPLQPAKALA